MPRATTKVWNIHPKEFPERAGRAEQIRFVLRYALLAPSTRNTQPWLFDSDSSRVRIYADFSRWQSVADADQRELHVSLGCALENLLIASEQFELGHALKWFPPSPTGNLVAEINYIDKFKADPARPVRLFEAITRRRTDHGVFDTRPVSDTILKQIRSVSAHKDVSLLLSRDAEIRDAVDKLLLRADALAFANPDWRAELAECVGSGGFGTPWLLSMLGQFAIAHLNVGPQMAKHDHKSLMSTSVFGMIGTRGAGPQAWVHAGQVLERAWLMATSHGLVLQPINQLLQAEPTREACVKLFRAGGAPIVPFRLGYPREKVPPTGRFDLSNVLMEE